MKSILVWIITLAIMVIPFISFVVFVAYFRTINKQDVEVVDGILSTVVIYFSVSYGLQFKKYINGKDTKKG